MKFKEPAYLAKYLTLFVCGIFGIHIGAIIYMFDSCYKSLYISSLGIISLACLCFLYMILCRRWDRICKDYQNENIVLMKHNIALVMRLEEQEGEKNESEEIPEETSS